MQIGKQIFEGITMPKSGKSFTLTSKTDPENQVVFNYNPIDISGIISDDSFETILKITFLNAMIVSASEDLSIMKPYYQISTFKASPSMTPGAYALNYDTEKKSFKLSAPNGSFWTAEPQKDNQTCERGVTFSNGFSFKTDAAFAHDPQIPQITFTIG